MKPRTFVFIAAALLALIILTNRLGSTKNEDTLQNALSLLLSGDTAVAESVENVDGSSADELLRQRFEPYFTDAALKTFLSADLTRRLPLLICQAGAEVTCDSAALESAENAMGYVFALPIHCICSGESRDFTLTGYAAFADDRLAALTVEGTDALERWLSQVSPTT